MCTTLEEQVRGYTKTTTPNYSERLQELCWNGEFLSMFSPDLQKLLKPIYDLTRKGRPFGERNNKILLKRSNVG